MAKGREKEIRKRGRGRGGADPVTFQMSLVKWAFTVERVRGNANAAGCHWLLWQIQHHVSLPSSLFFTRYLACSAWMCLFVRVFAVPACCWLILVLSEFLGIFSLLTPSFINTHTDINSHRYLRICFNNEILQTHTHRFIGPVLDLYTGYFWDCSCS